MFKLIKSLFAPPQKQGPDLRWISQWAAASEEIGPDGLADDFDAAISLPADVTYDAIVSYILGVARGTPAFDSVTDHLTKHFGLAPHDAITAIDRCMGGIFRAIESRPGLCPSLDRDPMAWHSFQMASADRAIIHDIESSIASYQA